jgi:serine/threonine-protein kinase
MSAPPFPEIVGRYELLAPIASGGMATVYLAVQRGKRGFSREVALKLTHAHLREQPHWAHDLVEEAKLASRIAHPNVVQVIDVDDDANGVFLVMPYVEGDTLSGLQRHAAASGGRLPAPIAFRILDDALAGLHAAHELVDDTGESVGLVHRDFSPGNVLVGLDGVGRLADFGVAKAATRVGYTHTGTIKGKFAYMSPEQVRGDSLDRRSDVWAAGIVAWELLAGQRMFPDADQPSTLVRITTEPPLRVRDVRPDAPAVLDEAIASALAIDVRRRCATAEELRRKLEAAWGELGGLADRAEVASWVKNAVAPKLAMRRAKIDEVLAMRARRERGAMASVPPPAEATTEASLVSENVPRPRRLSAASIGIAVVAAGALGVVAWRVVPARRVEAPVSAPSSVPPTTTLRTPDESDPAAPAPRASSAVPSASVASAASAELPLPSSRPRFTRPPRGRPVAQPRQPATGTTTASPPAEPAPPKLHETPYD